MRRCNGDEELLKSVLMGGKKGFIIDTRTQNVAQLAKTKGKSTCATCHNSPFSSAMHQLAHVS